MSISIKKPCTVLISFLIANLADANDLIAFGSHCLSVEDSLNKAESRLAQRARIQELKNLENGQTKDHLTHYFAEQSQLSKVIAECAATTPNSAYCHSARHQYNEISQYIQEETNDFNDDDHQESELNHAIAQHNFEERRADFYAQCRDSDTHYAFIQNMEAYNAVCSLGNNKQTVTCSLF